MRWLRVVLAAGALASCGPQAVEPGEGVGEARLVRGAAEDVSLWDFCDPSLEGRAHRTCSVPAVARLRLGPGWRAEPSAIERDWDGLEWDVRFDGRPVDLEAFGTLPDTQLGGGVVVREWNVTAQGLPPGAHRLRAVVRHGDRRYDVTWMIQIRA